VSNEIKIAMFVFRKYIPQDVYRFFAPWFKAVIFTVHFLTVSEVVHQSQDSKLQAACMLGEHNRRAVCVENTTGINDQITVVSNYLIINVGVVSADEHAVLTGDICGIERDARSR
jgi:hypothetical protein